MTLDDWCDYRVKIKCFAIFKRCFSNLVSKSLPSAFWHSAKTLPSARKKTLGKGAFAVTFFTECGLPSATLGKPFAECKRAFAECIRHSANKASPVVNSSPTSLAYYLAKKGGILGRSRSRTMTFILAGVAWVLWKMRNDWVFNHKLISSPSVLAYRIVAIMQNWGKMKSR